MADRNQMTFGVEIETEGRTPFHVMRAVANKLGWTLRPSTRYGGGRDEHYAVVVDAQGREWVGKPDGSLSGSNCEVVTPPLTVVDLPDLRKVVRAIRYSGARATSRCGLHVHVGAGEFRGDHLANLANLVYSNEGHIYRALGIGDSRNRWAAPAPERAVDAVQRARGRDRSSGEYEWRNHCNNGRYHGLNMCALGAHGTIEFRYFAGTLHAGKIRAYILLVLHLALYALNTARIAKARKRTDTRTDYATVTNWLAEIGMTGHGYQNPVRHLTAALAPASPPRGRTTVGATP